MSNAAIDAAQSARDTLLESSCSSMPVPSATSNQVELQWLNKVLRLLETKDGDCWVMGDVNYWIMTAGSTLHDWQCSS